MVIFFHGDGWLMMTHGDGWLVVVINGTHTHIYIYIGIQSSWQGFDLKTHAFKESSLGMFFLEFVHF